MQKIQNFIQICLIILACLISAGCRGADSDMVLTKGQVSEVTTSKKAAAQIQKTKKISVYVCGEVVHPGVYELGVEARITDAVKKAGGFTKKADQTAVNLAMKMEDGQQILIPAVAAGGNITDSSAKSQTIQQTSADTLVNIKQIKSS